MGILTAEDFKPGDLLFLTRAFEDFFRKKNPSSRISLANRIAKLEEIIDWGSEKGQKIKQARESSGKWEGLSIEDNKYIVSIYYHDLVGRNKERGVVERGVPLFRAHPVSGAPFFEKIPEWIYREIAKKCESFKIDMGENVS